MGGNMFLSFADDLKLLVCWNCVDWIRQNKRCRNNFAREVANFYGSRITRFYSRLCQMLMKYGWEFRGYVLLTHRVKFSSCAKSHHCLSDSRACCVWCTVRVTCVLFGCCRFVWLKTELFFVVLNGPRLCSFSCVTFDLRCIISIKK